MIIDSETKRKLREMNAAELLDAFERLDERTVMPLNHAEVVGLAVDNAYGGYTDAKIQRLVKRAGLRYPQADLRTIDLAEERGLDRGVLRTRRRQLPRIASERRVPGSHRIGQVVPAMRVGEIRVQGTLPGLLHTDARPRGTGRGRGPQAGRSGQARAQILHVHAARDRRMARGQARRAVQALPA